MVLPTTLSTKRHHLCPNLTQKTLQTDRSSWITWNCSLRYFYWPDGETSPTFPKTHLWLKLIKIPRFIIPIIATSFRMSLGSGWHMVVVVVSGSITHHFQKYCPQCEYLVIVATKVCWIFHNKCIFWISASNTSIQGLWGQLHIYC